MVELIKIFYATVGQNILNNLSINNSENCIKNQHSSAIKERYKKNCFSVSCVFIKLPKDFLLFF